MRKMRGKHACAVYGSSGSTFFTCLLLLIFLATRNCAQEATATLRSALPSTPLLARSCFLDDDVAAASSLLPLQAKSNGSVVGVTPPEAEAAAAAAAAAAAKSPFWNRASELKSAASLPLAPVLRCLLRNVCMSFS